MFNDPPLHTRVRRLIAGALTPRAIAAMEPGLIALVDGLLDAMAERKGTVDLIEDFAGAIPVEIIGNLLGVPHDGARPVARLVARDPRRARAGGDAGGARARQRGGARVPGLPRRPGGATAAPRPGDPEHDVLTRLIQGEADGERLTDAELLHNCIFLLNAGHETTTNLIGNGLDALLRMARGAGAPARRARADQDGGRGVPALRELEPARQPHHRPSRRARRRRAAAPAPRSRCASAPPTAIQRSSRIPTGSISPAPRTVTSPSAPARISAPACSSPGSKARIAIGRFLARFPDYALAGEPVRGGRARFRGFLSVPCEAGEDKGG